MTWDRVRRGLRLAAAAGGAPTIPSLSLLWRDTGTIATAGLGLNFWFAAAVLPTYHVSRGILPDAWELALLGAAPAMLVLGTWKRHPWLLLGLYPTLIAVTAMLGGRAAAATFGPVSFWTSALSFVAYCLAATALCRPRAQERNADSRVARRALTDRATPRRWRQRLRILRMLAVLTAAFPVVLLGALMSRDRSPPRLVEVATILPLWVGFFVAYLRAPAWAFYVGADEPIPSSVPRTRATLTMRWALLGGAAAIGTVLLIAARGS